MSLVEMKSRIWNGCIPTTVYHESTQEPLHLLLRRNAYLPFYSQTMLKYFSNVADIDFENENHVWYSVNSEPLKWHLPIGILYDLQCGNKGIPFKIHVHFKNYPFDSLLRYEGIPSLEDNYKNTLKESDYLRYGSCKKVMGLSKTDQLSLWKSLEGNDFESFIPIQSSLILQDLEWKFMCIRLHSNSSAGYSMMQFKLPWPENKNTSIHETLRSSVERQEFKLILHGIILNGDESACWYGFYSVLNCF